MGATKDGMEMIEILQNPCENSTFWSEMGSKVGANEGQIRPWNVAHWPLVARRAGIFFSVRTEKKVPSVTGQFNSIIWPSGRLINFR